MIKIIDSIMGSGKTSYVMQMIKANPENKYLYVTPYLDEVKRVIDNCEGFGEPEKGNGFASKIDSLNDRLMRGMNVVTTHALFKLTNKETREAIEFQGYTLILDEVAEVISSEEFEKDDLMLLVNGGLAEVDEEGYLIWKGNDYNGVHNRIKKLCNSRSVIAINDTALVWVFPVEIFKVFSDVFICTYLFDAQIQRYYFDLHHINYEYYRVVEGDGGKYELVDRTIDYNDDTSNISIDIYEGKKNDIGKEGKKGHCALSSSWYGRATKEQLKQLKKNLVSWYKYDLHNSPSSNNLWTCFKSQKKDLQASPYTKGFLACNARATNVYRDRTAVAYVINKFMSPVVLMLFAKHNIIITDNEQKKYALSELLQFVWRSAVRDKQRIDLYIPSDRMRKILQDFLGISKRSIAPNLPNETEEISEKPSKIKGSRGPFLKRKEQVCNECAS